MSTEDKIAQLENEILQDEQQARQLEAQAREIRSTRESKKAALSELRKHYVVERHVAAEESALSVAKKANEDNAKIISALQDTVAKLVAKLGSEDEKEPETIE